MQSKFMTKLTRRNTEQVQKSLNLGHVKDVLIAHYQSMGMKEIVDIDLPLTNPVTVTFYCKKGGSSRTRKDE